MQNGERKIWGRKTALTVVLLTLLVAAVAVALFVFGKIYIDSKYGEFEDGDGYIISSSMTEEGVVSTRQYFDVDTSYKNTYSGEVEFKNTSGDNVLVSAESFVHYLDGSLGLLKKAAVLDLGSLTDDKEKVITYYSMFPETVLSQIAGNYTAELQGNRIAFNTIMVKTGEDKYLIAAPNMSVKIDDTEHTFANSYVEVTYFDGGIIRVENQELTFQSISQTMDVYIGDIRIDLRNKRIFKNDVDVLDLALLTIDTNDAIALTEYTPTETSGEDGGDGGSGSADGSATGGDAPITAEELIDRNILGDLASGSIDTNIDTDGEINEYERLQEPMFTVTSQNVTANSYNATVEVEDPDGLLTGDTFIQIIEISTNNIVFQERYTDGETYFEVNTENLTPETGYAFTVTADYIKDNTTYSKSFIQKTFVTEAVGISFDLNYSTTDTIAIDVKRSAYSNVSGLTVGLYDEAGLELKSASLSFESSNTHTVTFSELNSNTAYVVKLEDFHYLNAIVANDFTMSNTYMTLKQRPTFGEATFTINKRDGVFTLSVNDISDVDGGILKYRYEIYSVDSEGIAYGNPVYVIEKDGSLPIDVPVFSSSTEGEPARNKPYIYRLVAIFNDNVREHEYASSYSSVMKMDGKVFPAVTFEKNEVTFERIDGTIVIVDDDGVLDTEGTITVTYQDSVGGFEAFTTSGSLNIPFYRDNLRKNETYTISVYGRVDLRDGNPAIDDCLVGRVLVQTEDTDPFKLIYDEDSEDITNEFSVTARLVPGDDGNTELEAETLSGITFKLYEGTSTSGKLIKTQPFYDEAGNGNYVSVLKEKFYDSDFVITPAFFDKRNSDLTAEYYTIEVTGAYDYTTYKNEIGIEDNIIIVTANGRLPDLPTNPDDAIEVIPIRNDNAGSHYDANLNGDTIVGYSIRLSYDNSGHFLRQLIYTLHAEDGRELGTYTVDVSASQGTLEYYNVYLQNGTEYNVVDNDFRRGNKYYFTGIAMIDLDADGTGETVWPAASTGITLRSLEVAPEKQVPFFRSYPVASMANSFNFQYRMSDVDKALYENTLYYNDGNNNVAINETNNYADVNFENLSAGILAAYYRYSLVKSNGVSNKTVINQEFDGLYGLTAPQYQLNVGQNQITIEFTDFATNLVYRRMSYIEIEMVGETSSKTLKDLEIDNEGRIKIDLSDIADLINQNVTAHIYFYYDNGIAGFSLGDSRVAVKYRTDSGAWWYNSLNSGNLVGNESAFNSDFYYTFSINNLNLALTDAYDGSRFATTVSVGEGGIVYNGSNIILKQLERSEAAAVGSAEFRFDKVVPGVSLLDEYKRSTIIPSLNGGTVTGKIYGAGNGNVQDDKIYLIMYDATGSHFVNEYEATINNGTFSFEIDDLQFGTQYYFRLYANVAVDGGFENTQLYNVDEGNVVLYDLKTLSEVNFSNTSITYYATSFEERYFKVGYTIDPIKGVDYVGYEVWRVDENGMDIEKVDLEISNDQGLLSNMTKNILIAPGSGVTTDAYYRVHITAYDMVGGEPVVLSTGVTDAYYFRKLALPYIGISSTKVDNDITFTVMAIDSRYAIVDSVYTIEILNSDGDVITPNEYVGQYYQANGVLTQFVLSNVENNKEYTFKVNYQVDVTNGGEASYEAKTKSYKVTAIDENSFYPGTISATADTANPAQIRLLFYNSNLLSSATKIHYYVYGSAAANWDLEADFVPTSVGFSDGKYYYFTLPNITLSTAGSYYIQLQFLDGNEVLGEGELEYVYMK